MTPHFIDSDRVRDRCIQLYSIVKAGCPNEDDTDDALTEAFVNAYRFNISSLLLDIAIHSRVLDDILRGEESDHIMAGRVYDQVVCVFEEGGEGELTLRETVNKVIHADSIQLVGRTLGDVWEDPAAMCRDHNGMLRLSGNKGKNSWTVLLSIEPLCREILCWLDSAEHNTRLYKLYQ